jgi:hypothetical protein
LLFSPPSLNQHSGTQTSSVRPSVRPPVRPLVRGSVWQSLSYLTVPIFFSLQMPSSREQQIQSRVIRADKNGCEQGDQIGRIFDCWLIVYFRQCLKTYRSSLIFGYLFPREKLCINYDPKWVGLNLWGFIHKP